MKKRKANSKLFMPALWEDSPSRSCPLLYRNILFFLSSFFIHKVFHTDSCDFKDQGFGKAQGLPRKEGHPWKKGERQQTVPWDQQSPRSCGKLKEPNQRRGKEPQPQAEAAF